MSNVAHRDKTRPRIQNLFGFWELYFGFLDGRVLDTWKCFWILGNVLSLRTTVHEAQTAAQPRTQGFPRTPPIFLFVFQRKALGTRSTAVGAHLLFHLPAA